MGNGNKGTIHGASDGGTAGAHEPLDPIDVLLGPATADQFNTVHFPLVPVACFRVDDVRFSFDSSFVATDPADPKKDIRAELEIFVELQKLFPESPLSVFGHADPIGDDEYNKQLSGRRAIVIYALLIASTDPDSAVKLWQGVARTEKWGKNQRQTMESFTGLPDTTPDASLMKAYLQKLCPPDLKVTKQDFLGQGADANGKVDYQGCSEFNPVLIFSAKKNSEFEKEKDKTARDDANSVNRRVMILMFQKGSKVEPSKWPCPRANEPAGVLFKSGCKKRFWSDGEKRRNDRLPDQDRKFDVNDDKSGTFACRFYTRLLTITKSPCESPLSIVKIRLFDPQGRPLPFAPCLITMNGKTRADRASGATPLGITPAGTPGSHAANDKEDGIITLRVQSFPTTVNVKWSRAKKTELANAPLPQPDAKGNFDVEDFEYELDVAIDIPDADPQAAAKMQLKNLGYDTDAKPPKLIPGLGDPVKAFQRDYKLTVDGTLSDPTIKAVKAAHDAADPVVKAGGDIKMLR